MQSSSGGCENNSEFVPEMERLMKIKVRFGCAKTLVVYGQLY